MSSSSASWYSSLECSSSIINSSDDSSLTSTAIQWLRFIFLSPCPQRVLFSSIDLIFLLTLVVLAIIRFIRSKKKKSSSVNRPLIERETLGFRVTPWFYVSLIVTALLALAYTGLCVFTFIKGVDSKWDVVEAIFRSFQAVTHVMVFVLIVHEKRFGAARHSVPIRAYWAGNLLGICLFVASAVIRLVNNAGYKKESTTMRVDDLFSFACFPLSVYLFVVTIRGSTGIVSVGGGEDDANGNGSVEVDSNVSGYATASLFSKAVWKWMNPLLTKGYKSPLTEDEVPSLPPDFRAEQMSELLEKNWPKPDEGSSHPVWKALLRCFWKDIVFTGFLAAVKLAVMYIGPLLIDSFVDYASDDRSNPFKGYYLVLTLFLAKVIEVLSSHHYNFHTAKLGMLMRCSLITTLYKKGLRLSCSARQTHGVGNVVNYMAVDSQLISDMVPQLHSVWMTPMQLVAAILLLYIYIGAPVVASVAIVFLLTILTFGITLLGNFYQLRVMKNRDSRIKAINELLGNMRVIKFQAWEEHFSKKIQSLRGVELSWLWKIMCMTSVNVSILWSVPNIISLLTFALAIWMKIHLDTGKVFTVMTVLKILQDPIRTFPQVLVFLSQTIICLRRLNTYMLSHELESDLVQREDDDCDCAIAVEVKNGNFSWDDNDEKNVLKDINFRIRKGELAAIVGTVGSGKSSLLASILGELQKSSGEVRVCGTTAYVAQSSWIQHATIQDNILFGLPMDRDRYNNAIRVCSLEKDLEVLEHGDQTEIGERGINLSGGQKQRIQLARAVYQDCDIYLLDDVFSAVDAQTGSEIFKGCVRGALKDKTILLVTHQVDFLHNADLILVMREGKIVQSGKYGELLESGMDFGALVAAHENSMELVEMSATVSDENHPQTPKSPHQQAPNSPIKLEGQGKPKDQPEPSSDSKLIEDEERESGHVSSSVYKEYCTKAYGWWGVVVVIVVSLLWQLALTANDYWLAYETSSSTVFKPSKFMSVYAIIGGISVILVAARSFLVIALGMKTSQGYFTEIIGSILHAPMSFFDTTPSGRILSRVTIDLTSLDIMIPVFVSNSLQSFFTLLGILVVICQNAWPTIFLLIPIFWLNAWYRKYFIASSRQLTRMDSITKAPILHHFSETVSGVMTIRSFRKQGVSFQGNIDRVNKSLRMDFNNNGANEWLGFRLELIGSFLLCISTLFMVMLPKSIIGSEYIGMALSYGLSLNAVIFYCVYLTCIMENKMVAVERIKQFINIPSEAAWKTPGCVPPPTWPHRGDIEIKDLKVRYRHNTPLVLKGISLGIHGGEKIGVVGRTGSGKSTLIQVFFRLVEPCGGKIVIDGIDICKVGLHDLRARFGIIPQEPILFEGTVRSNIDPLGLYSDDEIWRLLCLGRVMLKNSRILFMDEATASVDSQTDAVIQKVIREDFLNCTIITIAHRIPTVIDCNKVLVMDDGLAKEYDAPAKLLERPSLFGALVQEYSLRSSGV
nr:ABC transporter C family member 4-like [Ipomoea trifida]